LIQADKDAFVLMISWVKNILIERRGEKKKWEFGDDSGRTSLRLGTLGEHQ
jgi:hypothetical protein